MASTRIPEITSWQGILWPQVEAKVHALQRRIYRAEQLGQRREVRSLQRLLLRSRSAKLLAVRRVTQDNQGKQTAGIDGITVLEPEDRCQLVQELTLDKPAQPLRRVWIPKPGTAEQRPLGIPVIADRAAQALAKLALEPQWEARFEANSYGFRPGRSCHDALEALFRVIRGKPKAVLDADIAKCFDRIDQGALLDKIDTFPSLRRALKGWLQAGILDGGQLFPTEAGTPQGGVMTPPTMWQKAPFGALNKRGGIHPVDDSGILFANFDPLHQHADNLATRGPARRVQPLGHALGKLLQAADHQA